MGNAAGIAAETDVFIVGCGPCGLMMANEFGRRGVRTILVDTKSTTAFNPQANATQARSMEHYRRHGFADEIRAMGMPPDFPPDIAYFTRVAKHELARFSLPMAKDAKEIIKGLSGSWSAAELPHRVSQKYVEQVLLKHARTYPTNSVHFETRLVSFTDHGTHVDCVTEPLNGGPQTVTRAKYLVGADGARSVVRKGLGISLTGEAGRQREFMGGRMYAIYLKCPDYYKYMPNDPAWMNVTVNAEQRAFMTAVDGKQEFSYHFQLKPGQDDDKIDDAEAKRQVYIGWGKDLPIEIMSRLSWTAGYTLVAEKLRLGRVFIGGDAAHLFTPAGGMGYNTAIEDAVNLAWKLSAVLQGYGGDALLQSYETERGQLQSATQAMRAGLRILSAISLLCLNWKTRRRKVKKRGGLRANITTSMRARNSIYPALHWVRAMTVRPSSPAMARSRRRMGRISIIPAHVREDGCRICGFRTARRFTIISTSSGHCCAWGRRIRPHWKALREEPGFR